MQELAVFLGGGESRILQDLVDGLADQAWLVDFEDRDDDGEAEDGGDLPAEEEDDLQVGAEIFATSGGRRGGCGRCGLGVGGGRMFQVVSELLVDLARRAPRGGGARSGHEVE